jgi:hypothetical protein
MAKLTANPAKATRNAAPATTAPAQVQGLPAALQPAAAQVQALGQAPAIAAAALPAAAAMPAAGVATVQAAQATANAAHVLVALQVRSAATGASVGRKAAGYAVGRTVQQCRAAGITAGDIRWDMLRPSKQGPHANIVLAAPGTPAALAAQALYAGNLTPAQVQAHNATIAQALPALLAAQFSSVKAGTYCPAPTAPAQAPTAPATA